MPLFQVMLSCCKVVGKNGDTQICFLKIYTNPLINILYRNIINCTVAHIHVVEYTDGTKFYVIYSSIYVTISVPTEF